MTFARVLAGAGLTKAELAACYGVSRQTIHYWSTVGPPRKGTYLARMAETITAALLTAVAQKILPLGSMSKDARRKRVKHMIVVLQNLKPAPVK